MKCRHIQKKQKSFVGKAKMKRNIKSGEKLALQLCEKYIISENMSCRKYIQTKVWKLVL